MQYTTWKVRVFSDETPQHWTQISNEKETNKIYHGTKPRYLKGGVVSDEDPKAQAAREAYLQRHKELVKDVSDYKSKYHAKKL